MKVVVVAKAIGRLLLSGEVVVKKRWKKASDVSASSPEKNIDFNILLLLGAK